MKEIKEHTISARQACVIIVMCIFANKILLLPSLMYEKSKADAIFAILILFALDLIVLPIFFKLKQLFPNEKLYNILSRKISPFLTKLIYLIFSAYFMFKALLVFSVTYVYFKQQIYQDEFLFLAIIAFIPVINHATAVGLRSFARSIELLFSIVLLGFIACLAFSLFTQLSMPIFFISNAKNFFTTIYEHTFAFGDYIFLFLIIDKIQIKKGQEKNFYFYSLLGMGLILALFFLFYSKYQITSFMHNNALADILVFSVQFNAIGRLDIIAMLTVMVITLFQLEIYNYAFSESFLSLFPKLNVYYSIAVFDILFAILYYIFIGKYEILVGSSDIWSPVPAIFINYIIPLICLIIILIELHLKKKKKKDQTYLSNKK